MWPPMAEFVRNPAFGPQLERAISSAMADLARETSAEAQRNLAPSTIRSKVSIETEPPRREAGGEISAVVKYGRGLGPIFEGGTKQRFTRKGAARGAIATANRAMQRARDAAVRRGLDLTRYL
jgi:hypothetical protein